MRFYPFALSLTACLAGGLACDGREAPRDGVAPPGEASPSASGVHGDAKPVEVAAPAPMAMKPFTLVRADWTMGKDLSAILSSQRANAEAKNQHLYLELTASWCTSCKALHEAMAEPEMAAAFTGAYVVRIDVDELGQQAVTMGFNSKDIPAFYEVGSDGRATGRWIDGNAWAGGTPEEMAPALRKFFAAGAS